MSIQIHSSGTSPNLQTKTITPSSSTQYVKPDSSYDGLNQVTVNGDSNLIGGNIVNGKTIFGVSGTYSPSTILTSLTIGEKMTVSVSYSSSESCWVLSGILPSTNKKGVYIDLEKMVAIHFYSYELPSKSSTYTVEGVSLDAVISSKTGNIIEFEQFPYISIYKGTFDYSYIYHNACISPSAQLNTSTRELMIGLNYNVNDGLLDTYIKAGTGSTQQVDIYFLQ